MKRIYLLLLSCLFLMPLYAFSETTEGTEFWVTFMKNHTYGVGNSSVIHKLIVSSKVDTEVTVKNFQTGWSTTFSVQANVIGELIIPHQQGYSYYGSTVQDKGLYVESTNPISLYASNYASATYDATIVLPVTGLGDEYVIQLFESTSLFYEGNYKEFSLIATENNTKVRITPHAHTRDGGKPSVPYEITLQKGQTYLVESGDENLNLSGSHVISNYPIAVFAGHQCALVPDGNTACDHIVEQQLPVNMWGKKFALTKTYGQTGDYVMLTTTSDKTEVFVNGTLHTTINKYDSYTFRLTDGSAFVETSNPVACYLYVEGGTANGGNSDPSSVLISPIEQRVQEVTFATFETDLSRSHYVNVVTTKNGANDMTLDASSISNKFQPLKGNDEFVFAQIPIAHGTHTLSTNKDGFIGHVYGLGRYESYAYSVGSSTLDLSGRIIIEGVIGSDFDGSGRCYKKPITFEPQTNDDYDEIIWYFGDGTSSTDAIVTHAYDAPGTYEISMIVSNEDGRDTAYASFTLVDVLYDTISVVLCDGESFMLGEETYTYSKSGVYDITIPSVDGCDSIVTVNLTVNPVHVISLYDTICDGRSYVWDGDTYTETGSYTKKYNNKFGCDSTVTLHLTFSAPYSHEIFDTICAGETYTWDARKYTTTGVYTHRYSSVEGCDSVVTLNLLVGEVYNYEFTDTICAGETYVWNTKKYTTTGSYTQSLKTVHGCDSIVTLHLIVGELYNIEWSDTICDGETYTWNAETYTKTGSYTQSFVSRYGCDSIVTLHLIVGELYNHTLSDTICVGDNYTWDGVKYYNTGVYPRMYQSRYGCDSLVTLYLTVGEHYDIEFNDTICAGETYVWNKVKYTTSGTYTQSFVTRYGCDSVVTIHLFVAPIPQEAYVEAICKGEPYRFGGNTLVKPGVYVDTALSMYGCDSITTLTLRIHEPYLIDQYIEVCNEDTFTFRGMLIDKPGIYYDSMLTQHGCDSIYRLIYNKTPTYLFHSEDTMCVGATYTYRGKEYTKAGTYYDSLTTVSGCDSIYRLELHTYPTYLIYSLQTDDICADASTYEMVVQYDGVRPSHYNLLYSQKAKEQGFKDIIQAPFVNDTLNLPIPHATPYIRPDYYSVTLELTNTLCPSVSSNYETQLLVRYPSWIIEQNWQDVVAAKNAQYNGGYHFQEYNWYVNNISAAQSKSYLYLPSLQVGDEVVLYATRLGEDYAIPTCPVIIEAQDLYEQEHPIPVYPTKLSRANRNVTITPSNSRYWIYDMLGRNVASGVSGDGEKTVVELPSVSGSYFIMLIDSQDNQQVVHVLVE